MNTPLEQAEETPLQKIERIRLLLSNARDLCDVTTQQEITCALSIGIDGLNDVALDVAKLDRMPIAPPVPPRNLAQDIWNLGVLMTRVQMGVVG